MTDRAEHYIELARQAVADGERRLRDRRTRPPARELRIEPMTFEDVDHEVAAHALTPAERYRLRRAQEGREIPYVGSLDQLRSALESICADDRHVDDDEYLHGRWSMCMQVLEWITPPAER